MEVEAIRQKVKCCSCGGSLESGYLNIFLTGKIATWEYPRCGNILEQSFDNRAVAILCDICANSESEVKFCIEWETDFKKIIYHDIKTLHNSKEIQTELCKDDNTYRKGSQTGRL